jgi:hypothetical protein
MEALFCELVDLSSHNKGVHIVSLKQAQERLFNALIKIVPDLARAAATKGAREAKVLRFRATDKVCDGFAEVLPQTELEEIGELGMLPVLRGPREGSQRAIMEQNGAVPLLTRLRKALTPFGVRHYWNRSTGINELIVTW